VSTVAVFSIGEKDIEIVPNFSIKKRFLIPHKEKKIPKDMVEYFVILFVHIQEELFLVREHQGYRVLMIWKREK
jgi:hypothetical protein